MVKESLISELENLISISFGAKNIELVDLSYKRQGNKLVLKILADKPSGGITVDECALLNRQLGDMLEEKNMIDSEYILEVSSPGLDRCLKTKKDFLRCLNKELIFFLNDLVNGKCQWQGVVNKVDEDCVSIRSCNQIIGIPLTKINKAQLVIKK